MNVEKRKKDLYVFTDPGEEVDDEVAIWYLFNKHRDEFNLRFICVGGHTTTGGNISSENRVKRVKQMVPGIEQYMGRNGGKVPDRLCTIESFLKDPKILPPDADDFPTPTQGLRRDDMHQANTIVLQIAPIDEKYLPRIKEIVIQLEKYRYVLQGDLGSATNSKGKARAVAEYFKEKAYKPQEKDIGTNDGPKFTYANALLLKTEKEGLVKYNETLINEIFRVAFKNTLGRVAHKDGQGGGDVDAHFTAHLIGPNGANYNTANSVYTTITGKDLKEIDEQFLEEWILAPENISLNREVTDYIDDISYAIPFTQMKMTQLNQTEKSQRLGLIRMLYAFKKLFGINQMLYSNDPNFNANRINSSTNPLYEPFNRFKDKLEEKPNLELTPAYDLRAAYRAVNNPSIKDPDTIEEILNSKQTGGKKSKKNKKNLKKRTYKKRNKKGKK